MVMVGTKLTQEEELMLEIKERAEQEQAEEAKRQHELNVLKQKLQYQTRWKNVVRIVYIMCTIIPKTVVVLCITFLITCGRPVPNALYEFLKS